MTLVGTGREKDTGTRQDCKSIPVQNSTPPDTIAAEKGRKNGAQGEQNGRKGRKRKKRERREVRGKAEKEWM